MRSTYAPFDASAYLDNDTVIAECLTAAAEDPNPEVFLAALGDVAKARPYLDRMTAELANTAYAKNAAVRLADPTARVPLTCLGCH